MRGDETSMMLSPLYIVLQLLRRLGQRRFEMILVRMDVGLLDLSDLLMIGSWRW